MTRLTRLAVILSLAAVVLTTATGAFTATTAERSVEVSVAEPEDALLGLYADEVELDNGNGTDSEPGQTEEVALVTVENRFGQDLDDIEVDVDTGDSDSSPKLTDGSVDYPDSLGVGESGRVTAEVVCSNANENAETWTVEIDASGESVSVQTSVDVTVECTGDPPA